MEIETTDAIYAGITLFFLSLTALVFGQETVNNTTQTITQSGVGVGSIIAVVTLWDGNKSIMWVMEQAIDKLMVRLKNAICCLPHVR
ncbi:hypothetical protein [Sphingobacterium faecale]|uniref:TMhelix containing protein n=1 Tax=Sphingobacterium faecale TaxID=2803775 RepID=A0ABS1R8X9_9SPHI|nr:hypothetical protein [Sphingobacterium faecale]MBL1410999.1 hypothetical protein [Sphingobacterium faecale]